MLRGPEVYLLSVPRGGGGGGGVSLEERGGVNYFRLLSSLVIKIFSSK